MNRSVEWTVAAGFALALLLSVAAAFAGYRSVQQLRTQAESVQHTQTVITHLETLLAATVGVEAGQRGFTITGDERFLAPYTSALRDVPRELAELRGLLQDNALQRDRLEALAPLVAARLDFAERGIALRRDQGFEAARALIASGEGMRRQARLSIAIAAMRTGELELMSSREARSERTARRALSIILAGSLLGIAIAGIAVAIILRDLASSRQLRAQAQLLHESLERRALALDTANAQLKEMDRLKSEFLASMSHELRTPLNSIIGFTGILVQGLPGPLNDEQKKQLGIVQASARHLLGLINDVLDLTRIESGRMDVVTDSFRIEELVAEVTRSLAPMAANRGLRLLQELPPALPPLSSDRRKCYQVLLNLVNNALKFTEEGEVRIAAHSDGTRLHVSVTDTGIGIAPEHQRLLFEAFRQIEGSARRVYEGTGLGLHLSRRLLALLGGDIDVQSEPGRGSCFRFSLPLAREAPSGT